MKKVFKAIGGFFVKIWNWIKNTAWVQPLLIVGLIFGVIFSIRPIYEGIKSLQTTTDEAVEFYKSYKKSLKKAENSEADKLVSTIESLYNGQEVSNPYGDKFFLTFVHEGCTGCSESYEGFKLLKKEFKKNYKPDDGKEFKMYSIFTDETTDETTTDRSAFSFFLDRQSQFFLYAAAEARGSYYDLNNNYNKEDLDALEDADYNNFKTPTIILVDLEQRVISEVMFGTGSGNTKDEKAQLLLDCWNHKNEFAEKF